MLVLNRKRGETIRIGKDVEIKVVWIHGGRVQIGITAPRDVAVMRGELAAHDQADAEQQKAADERLNAWISGT